MQSPKEDYLKVNRKILPFTAIVGQDLLKQALILNAINQDLMGVIIKGQRGTAKSMAVRAMAELLPEEEFSLECPYGCSPEPGWPHCDICQGVLDEGRKLKTERRKLSVVTLPLSATEDKIVGSINIEKALKGKTDVFEPGLLAKANRGIIYIDEINLLDDNLVDILLDSAAMGVNIVEREGISIAHPSRFILVGTMNPEEGELRPQLTDRLGLYVDVKGIEDLDKRVEIIDVMEEFDADNQTYHDKFENDRKMLVDKINLAKSILNEVKLQKDLKQLIAKICVDFGIDGHRADILMSRCSKTIAAFDGRKYVERPDVEMAAKFIIPHRVRRDPFDEEEPIEQKLQQTVREQNQKDSDDGEQREENSEENPGQGQDEEQDRNNNNPENPQEKKDNDINFNKPPAGSGNQEEPGKGDNSGSGSQQPENRDNGSEANFMMSPGIEIKRDRKVKTGRGRRARTLSTHSGKYIKSRKPKSDTTDIAIDATIRSSVAVKGKIDVDTQDFREKVREKKKAVTTVFVVDASGSMGVGKRMEFARGALLSMLRDSYQKRDKVGFVIFKDNKANILLKPTSSINNAYRKMKNIPTGGRTPLSNGLLSGLKAMMDEMIKDKNCIPVIVLVSDGRANVSKNGGGIKKEIITVSREIKKRNINLVVIDADDARMKLGYIDDIVRSGEGIYFHLNQLIGRDFRKSVGIFTEERSK